MTSTCQLSKTDLKARTEEYWEKSRNKERFETYQCYIEQLLLQELEAADKRGRLRGLGKNVHTLALTVDGSFEPSACCAAP